jgi:hypothetical protein
VLLAEAVVIIADALEKEGWPRVASAALIAQHEKEFLCSESDRAHRLLAQVQEMAEKKPAFQPWVQRALELYAAAKRRADRALAKWRSVSDEPCRLGSADEALRQLREAGFNADLEAIGDFVKSPKDCPSTVKLPPAAFGPAAEIHRLGSFVIVPWGFYTSVRFRDDAIAQIWAPSPAAPRRELKDLAIWMLDHARREAPRKLKRNLAIKECVKETGPTWRQAAAAYETLPMQYRYKRGAPGQSRLKSDIS